MVLTRMNSKQTVLLATVLLALASCKQSEFYDKAALLDPGKATKTQPTSDETSTPTASNPNGTETTTDVTIGTTLPPIVVEVPNPTTIVSTNPPTEVVTNPPTVVVTNPPTVVITNPPTVVITNPPTTGTTDPATQLPINLIDRAEVFTQNSIRSGDVDILWVIDDSGSMADNQDALARNFNNFISQFLDKKIDFKMAITTTDGTSTRNGKMVGDSGKLTSASAIGNRAAFTNNFTKWVKVGTSGSGIEQGLKCASSFLDRYSASFLRPDAYLAIVFVSDENDQSDKKVSEYIARFQSAKTNKGMVKAYSIVTEKLPANAQWETIGKRYNEASVATSGTTSEITEDFSGTLKDIGAQIVKLIDSFALNGSPVNNTVQVFVNNIETKSGWSYDLTNHSIKFDSSAVPLEGSKIEVRYKVQANVLGAI